MKRQWLQIVGIAIGGNLPIVVTAYLTWNVPVKGFKHGGYGYLGHNIGMAWICVLLFATCSILTYQSNLTIRALIKYYIRQAKLWGTGHVFVRMSEQEAWALNTHAVTYKAKKIKPKTVKYSGIERRKRA